MLVMGYYSEKTGGPCEDPIMEPLIAKQIRTAVAAETERCAVAAFSKSKTIGIMHLYADGDALRAGREIAAAIRRAPEPGAEEEE